MSIFVSAYNTTYIRFLFRTRKKMRSMKQHTANNHITLFRSLVKVMKVLVLEGSQKIAKHTFKNSKVLLVDINLPYIRENILSCHNISKSYVLIVVALVLLSSYVSGGGLEKKGKSNLNYCLQSSLKVKVSKPKIFTLFQNFET